jgi:hypothetical protein
MPGLAPAVPDLVLTPGGGVWVGVIEWASDSGLDLEIVAATDHDTAARAAFDIIRNCDPESFTEGPDFFTEYPPPPAAAPIGEVMTWLDHVRAINTAPWLTLTQVPIEHE